MTTSPLFHTLVTSHRQVRIAPRRTAQTNDRPRRQALCNRTVAVRSAALAMLDAAFGWDLDLVIHSDGDLGARPRVTTEHVGHAHLR